jgi:hypothetical protein
LKAHPSGVSLNAKAAKAAVRAGLARPKVNAKVYRANRILDPTKEGTICGQAAAPGSTPSGKEPSDTPTGPIQSIRVLPEGGNNGLFNINQRFGPEFAQSVTITEPISLESLTLDPRCITLVPLSYYSGPNQDHSLEQFTCRYPNFNTTVTMSIYKIADAFAGNPSRLFVSQLTPITQIKKQQTMTLESPYTVKLDKPTRLDPGHYLITFGFELTDPNINTIWFGGHNHNEGPQPACVTNPASDIYTTGAAYRGEPNNTYTGLVDNFRGFANMFVMHTAKVQSCIVVGNFTDDVFTNGDINLMLQFRPIGK